jgi:hypothetical protein
MNYLLQCGAALSGARVACTRKDDQEFARKKLDALALLRFCAGPSDRFEWAKAEYFACVFA